VIRAVITFYTGSSWADTAQQQPVPPPDRRSHKPHAAAQSMRPGYHTQQIETKEVGTGVGTALGGIGVRALPVSGTAGGPGGWAA
jgi:hypothetical protein